MPRDEFRKMTGYNDFTAYSGFKLIGRGGSGSVYEVIRNGTRYAMKIPLQFSPNDDRTIGPVSEGTKEGFLREADSLNSLSNKCSDSVVTMEDYGTVPFPWIVMEFAEEDLRSAIDKGTVSIHDLIDILRGLDRIHSSGYRHLDIKPENIMRVGTIWKFTDFGLSNPINSVSVSLSKNEFAGTIQYSAPEQVSGKKYGTKDNRTDIWQMAVVIYEFLAKRRPYDSDDQIGRAHV